MNMNKKETEAFAIIGAAICDAKAAGTVKKTNLATVAKLIAKNRSTFLEGVTIGGYRFKLISRDDLTAVKI